MEQLKIESMSFEQALMELEKIARNLETGNTPLEESINAYERGIMLKKHCEEKLNKAKEKIEKITIDSTSNSISTEPFNAT